MFDYVRFLIQITGDDTWHQADNGKLLNASGCESHFTLDKGTIMLWMNGKAIYCGPLVEEHRDDAG